MTCIADGFIEKNDGASVAYELRTGIDYLKIQECDVKWKTFTIEQLKAIKRLGDEEQEEYLHSMQLEDFHWDWFKKALILKEEGYDWFSLWVEDRIQGMCITYQPKKSVLNTGKIFYIEYLAVAPWNRDSKLIARRYKKIASIIIARITEHMSKNKGLIPAFSLHSSPQAVGFYERIGMIYCPDEDKDGLKCYEIPVSEAKKFMEAYIS